MRPGNEGEWVDCWVYTVAHLYDEVDITAGVGDVEYGRPGEAGQASLVFAVSPLVLDVGRIAVKVE